MLLGGKNWNGVVTACRNTLTADDPLFLVTLGARTAPMWGYPQVCNPSEGFPHCLPIEFGFEQLLPSTVPRWGRDALMCSHKAVPGNMTAWRREFAMLLPTSLPFFSQVFILPGLLLGTRLHLGSRNPFSRPEFYLPDKIQPSPIRSQGGG